MEYHGIAWDSMVWDNMEYSGIQWNNVEQLEIARCSGDQKTWKTALRAKMALDGQRGHRWGIGKEGFHAIPCYSTLFHAALGPSFHMVFCGVRFGPWIIPQ